jgi:universal stress protein A
MVMTRPHVLCPVDFSDSSRAALCYAAAVADHFGATLTVMTVEDPLLAQVVAGAGHLPPFEQSIAADLRRFYDETFAGREQGAKTVDMRVTVGKPADQILEAARELRADLIVISSHGRSGVRRMFFGSTTERVLRETTVPVLVTPPDRVAPFSLSELGQQIHRVIAPVDLTDASPHQVTVAAGIAGSLGVPLIVAHAMEPLFVPPSIRMAVAGMDASRRAETEERLATLASAVSATATETLVVTGEPSEEIVKLASTRDARLIVMGLHSSGLLGPRMGSVTYRVLCLTHALVLALPPAPAATPTALQATAARA